VGDAYRVFENIGQIGFWDPIFNPNYDIWSEIVLHADSNAVIYFEIESHGAKLSVVNVEYGIYNNE